MTLYGWYSSNIPRIDKSRRNKPECVFPGRKIGRGIYSLGISIPDPSYFFGWSGGMKGGERMQHRIVLINTYMEKRIKLQIIFQEKYHN